MRRRERDEPSTRTCSAPTRQLNQKKHVGHRLEPGQTHLGGHTLVRFDVVEQAVGFGLVLVAPNVLQVGSGRRGRW